LFFVETLFLVPIYRQSKEKYSSELKEDFKKFEQNITNEVEDINYLKHFYDEKEREKRYGRWVKSEGNSIWELNQIIGWIQFYIQGINIKANLWFTSSKKLLRRPKRTIIEYRGKLGDVTDIAYNDNLKLKTDILKFIDDAQKGSYGFGLEKYHINPDWILKILDHLDIRAMVQSNIID